MQHAIYAKLTFEKQGLLKGDSTTHSLDRKDTIECHRFFQKVDAPRDGGTGLATGRRTHSKLEFRMEIGQASPLLFQACCTNESLTTGEFRFFTHGRDGKEVHYYTCKVEDGTVASISNVLPEAKDPQLSGMNDYNIVELTFRRITYTHVIASKEYCDDWRLHNG